MLSVGSFCVPGFDEQGRTFTNRNKNNKHKNKKRRTKNVVAPVRAPALVTFVTVRTNKRQVSDKRAVLLHHKSGGLSGVGCGGRPPPAGIRLCSVAVVELCPCAMSSDIPSIPSMRPCRLHVSMCACVCFRVRVCLPSSVARE